MFLGNPRDHKAFHRSLGLPVHPVNFFKNNALFLFITFSVIHILSHYEYLWQCVVLIFNFLIYRDF